MQYVTRCTAFPAHYYFATDSFLLKFKLSFPLNGRCFVLTPRELTRYKTGHSFQLMTRLPLRKSRYFSPLSNYLKSNMRRGHGVAHDPVQRHD